jgi:HPt (histidine-containing phosphotransfer) domain-containing protein
MAGTALPEIEGLNIAAGMARVGGSASRYRDLLHTFLPDAEARFALLEAVPDKSGLQSFTTFAHALKSGLANIGANALSEAAAVLETAGRNEDIDVIRGTLASFREELAALMARIRETTAYSRNDAGGAGRENAPPALLHAALAELKTALEARDTDRMDIVLAKLQHCQLAPETHAAVADMAQQVLFGDFKKAAATVNSLLERKKKL